MKTSFIKRLLPVAVLIGFLFAPLDHMRAQDASAPAAGAERQTASEAQSSEKNQQEEDENDKYLHSATVRALGAKIGLNAEQAATAFTVANFVVLAALVGWFLAKTLPKTFRNRNTSIQKQLVDARTATEDANARLSSVEDRLSKLDGQIAAMRSQSEKDSALDEQRIAASVEEEKQKILAAAEQEITAATALAQRQIQQYAAELAIEQAARKLVVTAETDRLLVQSFAQRLTGDDSKKGQN
ncbi:F-type H+-transporting ATPase subunit b [Edaphobacter lichenicola]|uniref:ATP synthase subunit b n=1 Tax=Tunturiibacter lichenicola TaxID=2051959 RepID=A0A7W8N299_9BACT|nr:F-type H+-transporting ATPase subunit b [Edaphobacter lichenicola]